MVVALSFGFRRFLLPFHPHKMSKESPYKNLVVRKRKEGGKSTSPANFKPLITKFSSSQNLVSRVFAAGVIQNGGQLPLRKDPGNEDGPSILGAYHLAKKIRKFRFEVKLWTTSRGSPLFPFGTEFAKCSYHLRESFRFQATSEKIE